MNTTIIFKKNLQQIQGDKTIIVNEGGQHSSKTYSILQLIVFLASTEKNKLFTIVGESIPFLKVGAMRQFVEILQNEGIYDDDKWNATDRIYKLGTNIIEFKAYDSPSKALGAKRSYLFINEVINIPFDTYQNLEGRTDICTFIDYNPSHEFYVHTKILGKDNVGYVHSTFLDNPYLPIKVIETIKRYKEYDQNRWRVMGEGLLGSNDGLVFQNWNIVDDFEQDEKTIYGLDFGFTNDPTTCIGVYKQNGELYIDEIFYGMGLTNSDISTHLEQNDLKKRFDIIYADSAEPKSIDELSKRGWNIKPSVKGPDSIQKGIDNIKQYKLNISKRSINLIKELRGYQWMKDRDGKLLNKPSGPDHCFDKYTIVNTSYGYNYISNIKEGEYVLTSNGFKRVMSSWCSGEKDIYNYKINNIELKCTNNHKIKIKEGWKEIQNLQIGNVIYQHKNLTVKFTQNMSVKNIIQTILQEYMLIHGNIITEKYQKDIIYIIKMVIEKIIELKILNVKNVTHIYLNTLKNIMKKIKNSLNRIWINKDILPKNGMEVEKVSNGIGNMRLKLTSAISYMVNLYVNIVVKKQIREILKKDSVQKNVNLDIEENQELITSLVNANIVENHLSKINTLNVNFVQEVAVTKLSNNYIGYIDVYDLQIDEEHEFIANGLIVHNCLDALRYSVISMENTKKPTVIRF